SVSGARRKPPCRGGPCQGGLQIVWSCKVEPTSSAAILGGQQMTAYDHATVPDGSTGQWRDKKRYLWLIGLVVPSLAFIAIGMWRLTGWGAWFWIGPVVILVIVPAIDLVAGRDGSTPPDDVIEALEKDRYYRWITYLFLPIQYVGFVGAMYLVARGGLPAVDKVGIAISIGCI